MVQYLHDNPRDGRPSHKKSMSPEDAAEARMAYGTYQQYFGVPN